MPIINLVYEAPEQWKPGANTITYSDDRFLNGYLDNVIFENTARTAQEISEYYNLTKGNYGL